MHDIEKIIEDLTDIGGWIAGRVGFERAKNFLHTIDEAVALLKEQEELLHKKQKDIDRLCNEISEWKHKYHDRPLKEQEPVRCKDCAYAIFKEGVVQHEHIICTKPFTERWQSVKPNNWYCADGVKKDA